MILRQIIPCLITCLSLSLFFVVLPVSAAEVPSASEASPRQDNEGSSPEKSVSEEPPPGSVSRITSDIFERKGGYVHPFLSVGEFYTDNVFNTREDKKSDFLTILTPGIWLSVPSIRENLTQIETANITPGGASLSRFIRRYPGRFQTYLFYKADMERFGKFGSENTTNHIAEGMVQYNFRGGFSIDLMDQFLKSHNERGSGVFFALDKFNTNLFTTILSYEAGDRVLFRADYTNYIVRYTATRNDFRDRNDNGFSAYAFYRVLPRTAVFAEYEFLKIRYDQTDLFDSSEHHLFGGVRWDITAKSRGMVKAGYGKKDFKDPAIGGKSSFIFEAQADYKFTPKTSLKLVLSRKTNETDIFLTNFIVSDGLLAEYVQNFTPKITGTLNLSYSRDRYEGDLTFEGETKRPVNKYYRAALAFQYEFKEWLKADAGYVFSRRSSNFAAFDYTNNTFFARLTGSM